MHFVFKPQFFVSAVAFCVLAGVARPQNPSDDEFFIEEVLPVLQETCLECHNADKQKGGLRLDSRTALLRGGDKGVVVVAGDPDKSLLVQAVLRTGKLKMPPKEELFPQDVEVLTEWVRRGMPWPEEAIPASPKVSVDTAKVRDVPVVQFAIEAGAPIKFDRDIRPLLADRCYACHGPDAAERKANLRLDDASGALSPLPSGRTAIVPGNLEKSQLFQRIAAASPDDRMPPADFHKTLNAEEIQRLGRWILQGAQWEQHWAFQPVRRPDVPEVSDPAWLRSPIDGLVLARLDAEALAPAPEADRRALIRRVTLDLTGLPPTLEEVRAFVADARPDAYERLVDRLLASPRYGEHMARYWLDAARYADTNGYHIDNMRFMWRWRDWVIDAFNSNKPFDEFTIEQLAGDLLPNPTLDQRVATGFNRNHMINFEGGAIPEEYRIQYVMDRVDTTSTVWLGLTVHCAQCHDHKFDPITQREFYQFAAYFNTIEEQGLDAQNGNGVPMIAAPLPDQDRQLSLLERKLAALNDPPETSPERETEFAEWTALAGRNAAARWLTATPQTVASASGTILQAQPDWSFLASGEIPASDVYEATFDTTARSMTAVRLEAMRDPSLPDGGPGRGSNSNFVLTEFEVDISPIDAPEKIERLTFARAAADYSQPNFPIENAIDGKSDTGWAGNAHELHEARAALFIAEKPFGFDSGTRVTFRMKHESQFAGHSIGRFRVSLTSDPAFATSSAGPWYANGPFVAKDAEKAFDKSFPPERARSVDLGEQYRDGRARWFVFDPTPSKDTTPRLTEEPSATYLYRELDAPTDRVVHATITSRQRMKIWINGDNVLEVDTPPSKDTMPRTIDLPLRAGANSLLVKVVDGSGDIGLTVTTGVEISEGLSPEVRLALSEPAELRRPRQMVAVRDAYFMQHDPEYARNKEERDHVQDEIAALKKEMPTTMVMAEMAAPRPTFMLSRGEYDKPLDEVKPGTPAFLPPVPADEPNNRLALAQWLVDGDNPLTARVTVNRFWQRFFGQGLVKSSEDFGTQGAPPTNPELLDWLASEFVRTGWDVKNFMRMLATSATYRQSAKPSVEAIKKDPENLLYSRGPRFRMDAETVRDNALALSGLLVEKVGGPSVFPYQPEGLWEEVSYKAGFTAQYYEQGQGPEQLYRRSMYTFWKRTSPPPGMMVFDAPNRETCTVRRGRTNTPLQALALMNDPQYVEASRAFAERILDEGGRTAESRVAFAFELATSRPPDADELAVLVQLYESQRRTYHDDAEAAAALLEVGDSSPKEKRDPVELAAWTVVASTLLNLDETISIG